MAKRRSFVPENPAGLTLEVRMVPTVSGWFKHAFKEIGDYLTPVHHAPTASEGIEQMWKDSAKLSRPHPEGLVHEASKGLAHEASRVK